MEIDKEKVQFYAALLGTLASVTAVSYIAWQHKKNQASFQKQDALLKMHTTEGKILGNVDSRLRNLEYAQCSSPHVRQSPVLMNMLNCPQSEAAPVQARPQMQAAPSPGAYVNRPPYGYQAPEPSSHLLLPNYGFYGDGPAGTGNGAAQHNGGMMGAFAQDPPLAFQGFGGGSQVPVPFEK